MSPFFRFILTGSLAALVNIGARMLLSLVMPFRVAVLIAFVPGLVTAYVLARLLVFQQSGQTVRSEFFRFALVNVVALAQISLISIALVEWLFPLVGFTWYAELVGHTIAVGSPIITSYYGHKLFTFRRSDA